MTLPPKEQRATLADLPYHFEEMPGMEAGLSPISVTTFQINLGKKCNQACLHCHVDASPIRTEMMSIELVDECLRFLDRSPEIKVVDITGGAPELHPEFRRLVRAARSTGRRVIDRCNLTILEEPGNEDLAAFLAENEIEVIASLPHFSAERTDRQRGRGVFQKSIAALHRLNELGYGTRLPLHLVYNPSGFFLSSGQASLEREFRENLGRRYGIVFTGLYVINNLPISRFLSTLLQRGKLEEYMETLVTAYNPATLEGLMCRSQISVGYDGRLYDCDFNQMLEIECEVPRIETADVAGLLSRRVQTHAHCFGCTAGAGSSCGGEIAPLAAAADARAQ